MSIKIWHEKKKKKRRWTVVELLIGIAALAIAAGLFATSDKYGMPTLALLTAVYMLINARINLL